MCVADRMVVLRHQIVGIGQKWNVKGGSIFITEHNEGRQRRNGLIAGGEIALAPEGAHEEILPLIAGSRIAEQIGSVCPDEVSGGKVGSVRINDTALHSDRSAVVEQVIHLPIKTVGPKGEGWPISPLLLLIMPDG